MWDVEELGRQRAKYKIKWKPKNAPYFYKMNILPCACNTQRHQRNLVVPNNFFYQFCSPDYLHTSELTEVAFHVLLPKWLESHGDEWDFSHKENKSFDKRGSRIYQIWSKPSYLLPLHDVNCMHWQCACHDSKLNKRCTGRHFCMFLVLFSLLRTDPVSKDIFSCICQPTALQLISSTHLSPLTWGLTSQMHSFFTLLILFHSEAVGAMQGPLLRWSSGSLKLCHPVQGQCSVNCIFFISSLMKLRLWLQETVLPDLLTSPMSRTWSFEVELYSEYNKEHSGTHIPNTCIVPWPLLRLMGSEVSDLTLKHRISSNRAK